MRAEKDPGPCEVPWFAPAHLQKALALSALGRQRDAMVAFRSGLDLVERARRAGFEIELKGIEWTEPPPPSDDPIGDAHRHELVDAACEEFPAYCRAVAACFGDECALRLFRRAVPRLLDRWASTASAAGEFPFGDEAPSRDLHACQLAAGWIAGRNFDTANWLFDALPAPLGEDERLNWDTLRSIAREGGRESRAGER